MKIICTLVSFLFFSGVNAQVLERNFVEALDSFSLARPQEKAYVQTDKTQYIAGETIWLKTYTTLFEKPTVLSKLIYVILANSKGEVIEKKQLKLDKSVAAGNIDLKMDLPTGEYHLRAYTLWMLNNPLFLQSKKIVIHNTSNSAPVNPEIVSDKIELKFFPEGGQMVEGIASNVSFIAVDEQGNAVNISGSIIDSKNKNITTLSTQHDGMGVINFMPLAGETYYAKIAGQSVNTALPIALKEGVTLSADNINPNKTFIKLERGQQNKAQYNEFLLVAQKNYEVVYMAKINFDEGMDAAAINKKNMSPGIMQITIFNNAGVPVAERNVFVANHEIPAIITNTLGKNKREKNLFEVDLSGYKGPSAAVSVVNYQADNKNNDDNILSGLLLNSDLNGYIHQPAQYFRNKEAATLQHLDLLMMVNGWSRYRWEDILQKNYSPLLYPFETSLSITGKVLNVNEKTALKDGKINLIIKSEDSTTIMSEANVNGSADFVINDLDYKQSATIYYQGTNKKKENGLVSAKINPAYFDSLKKVNTSSFPIKKVIAEVPPLLNKMLIDKRENDIAKEKLLQEVIVKARRLSPADSITRIYASPIFEQSDQTLIMDKGNYYDIWQYLQRQVPGMSINKTDTGKFVTFDRYNGLNFFSEEMPSSVQFFLNEVPVSVEIIDFLNPQDVSLVKVFKGVSGIALGADRGAIAIYTNKGGTKTDWRTKGFDFIKKAGYSVKKEFYQMDYSKVKPDSDLIDNRPTLLWQPEVKVINGKAIIEFYNDDYANQFKLLLEGMDENGKLFSIEKIIE